MTATEQPDAGTGRRVRAVDHALNVLDCLGRSGRPLGVSDIARQTGLSKATVHHLLSTLTSRRFVMQDPYTSLYRLGWALYELGSSVVRDVELSRAARPSLDRLAADTGESVLLGILDDDAVLYLDRGESPRGFYMVANAGRRGSLHATASGKVLLAFAPDAQLVDRILNTTLEKYIAAPSPTSVSCGANSPRCATAATRSAGRSAKSGCARWPCHFGTTPARWSALSRWPHRRLD